MLYLAFMSGKAQRFNDNYLTIKYKKDFNRFDPTDASADKHLSLYTYRS